MIFLFKTFPFNVITSDIMLSPPGRFAKVAVILIESGEHLPVCKQQALCFSWVRWKGLVLKQSIFFPEKGERKCSELFLTLEFWGFLGLHGCWMKETREVAFRSWWSAQAVGKWSLAGFERGTSASSHLGPIGAKLSHRRVKFSLKSCEATF